MMPTFRVAAFLLAFSLNALAAGLRPVETARFEWPDAPRQRTVPAKVYFPRDDSGPFPLIVFSHGLGGTREGYEYLGRHWASNGYVCVHLQHPGSDDSVWRGQGAESMKAMQQAAASPMNAIHRPLDVKFALDQLFKLNAEPGPWRGRMDTNRVGLAGHSFGAFTTLAVAGQVFGPNDRSVRDARVKAGIAMSAPVPRQHRDRAYRQIQIPLLHMTGTADSSAVGDTTIAERRIPFDQIDGAEQFLVTFTGGDHMVFSGRSGLRGGRSKDAVFHGLIRQSTTAFWDAYLKEDAKAKDWLAKGGFAKALGADGVFEQKPAGK